MKVQIIADDTKFGLELKLNDILRKYENDEIVDIKYSTNMRINAFDSDEYSAMIIFK